jgi:hypothetical protein
VPQGRIVGGEVTAADTIVVGQAGSESRVSTRLVVAGDKHTQQEIAAREAKIRELDGSLSQIHHAIDPLIWRADELPIEKQQAIERLVEKTMEIEKAVAGLHEEIEDLRAQSAAKPRPFIRVNHKLYSECVLSIGLAIAKVREDLAGPLQAVVSEGVIKLHSITAI